MRKELDKRLNLFVPQWQDSGDTPELYDGAMALRKYLQDRITFIDLVVRSQSDLSRESDIQAYRVVRQQLELIKTRLEREVPGRVFTLGGGCGIEVPVLAHLTRRYSDMDIFWFDAHGDINSPESSVSKHFHGMPLRFLLETIEGSEISRMFPGDPSRKVILLGTRDLDPPEEAYIREKKIPLHSDRDILPDPEGFCSRLLKEKNRFAYIHIDLDVLDPSEYPNVKCPSGGGIPLETMSLLLNEIFARRQVVGMSLLENTGTNPGVLARLEPILEKIPRF